MSIEFDNSQPDGGYCDSYERVQRRFDEAVRDLAIARRAIEIAREKLKTIEAEVRSLHDRADHALSRLDELERKVKACMARAVVADS